MPDRLNKVVAIAGDITEPNLAIKNDDIKFLNEKVWLINITIYSSHCGQIRP